MRCSRCNVIMVEAMNENRPTPGPLMAGKRGLIMGVANDKSIAWGVAKQLASQGADLAFTYQNDAFAKRVAPLAESVGDLTFPCDVASEESMTSMVAALSRPWDRLDFVLHAVAYADKAELKGRYMDTSRENFEQSLAVSCYSFTELARLCRPLMTNGGSLVTLTYLGANRVTPNYNVMGVAKAALEASVRYLAVDLGGEGIRVNAISAGPMKTLAGSKRSPMPAILIGSRRTMPRSDGMSLWTKSETQRSISRAISQTGSLGKLCMSMPASM